MPYMLTVIASNAYAVFIIIIMGSRSANMNYWQWASGSSVQRRPIIIRPSSIVVDNNKASSPVQHIVLVLRLLCALQLPVV
jgi:hypothetical protein